MNKLLRIALDRNDKEDAIIKAKKLVELYQVGHDQDATVLGAAVLVCVVLAVAVIRLGLDPLQTLFEMSPDH